MKFLNDEQLIAHLRKLVQKERRTTAEILETLKEVDARRLYLKLGFTSLFAYLTEGLGYSAASAQRRIESARLLKVLPELKNDLESGELNLMQVSLVAQAVRQKKALISSEPNQSFRFQGSEWGQIEGTFHRQQETSVENQGAAVASRVEVLASKDQVVARRGEALVSQRELVKSLLSEVKGLDLKRTQKLLATELDLPLKSQESTRLQKDSSTRLEITLREETMRDLARAKELLSHKYPHLGWAELISLLAEDFLKRKDPLRKGPLRPEKPQADGTSGLELSPTSTLEVTPRNTRRIPAALKRAVHKRDRCCQWKEAPGKAVCGSRFQLEIDHQRPVWAGGAATIENLQLLCAVHNRMKYRREANIRGMSS